MKATTLVLAMASSCLTTISVPALAQDAPQAAAPQTASADDDANASKEIVVTGSRVITNGDASPTPVTVITTTQLQTATPSNIPDALNKLPVFSASRGQATVDNASSNATGNFLNLRGIGVIRTLILFDGHRVPATASNGTVDVNTVPQMLLQRVDVVTGGASAVYGSDAVTGVVNFVVDKKFKGFRASAQAGISGYGDNGSQRLGFVAGTDLFGGRGHIEGSFEYYNSDGIDSKLARENGRLVYSEEGAGTAANPFHLVANTRSANSSFGGKILQNPATLPQNPLADMEFATNGVLTSFVHGTPSGSTGIESGGNGTYSIYSSLLANLRSRQGFGRFDYDLTDNVSFYAQGSYSSSDNGNVFTNFGYNQVTLSAANPYLPDTARTAMANAGVSTFIYSKSALNISPYRITSNTQNYFANAGFTGKFGGDFTWDLSFSRGQTRQHTINVNNVNAARLYAALDAVQGPNGIVCNVTLTNPGLYPGCIAINPFGPTAENPDAINWVRENTDYVLKNRQDDIFGTVAGSPFDTWAGSVKMALSGEWRRLKLDNVSSAQPTSHPSCTGLRFNCTATTPLYLSNIVADAHAAESISEGAFEIDVPLLKDSALGKSLNVNGAVRYAHYSASGNATTWKVGLDWRVFDDLRLRGTRSQDIRAPTLTDLFAPINASPTGFTDTHTNTAGVVTTQSQGNPNLVPEVAQTLTVGAVYRPHWLPKFSLAVDYYKISIDKAIATVGGNNAATLAQCEASNGTSPLCALYVRPLPFSDRTPANYPTLILSQALNVASLKSHGIDTEVNYATRLGAGDLSLRGLASYQPKLVTVQFAGAVPIDAAGTAGTPSWKLTGFVDYKIGGFDLAVQERWRNAEKQSGNPTLVFSDPKIPAAAFTDLNISYTVKPDHGAQAEFFLSIQNLFNKTAAVYISPAYASSPGFYYPAVNGDDVVGRYFTAGVRTRF
jgi:iron complex outermembrane recepter protein